MLTHYFPLLLMLLVCALTIGGMIYLSTLLGPKKRSSSVKETPFECGVKPFQLPVDRFSIRFYLIAMLFILFDIEIVFLFPWAVVFKSLGGSSLAAVFIFIAILGAGYLYAWKKGALEWE
jgi:NADH-quinone oxidoreductase subunit A